ncbi:MAG: glycosyltransferase family 4 protein [Candidatus Hydrogenedentes bacterium]|nr:glycosyltransferase family 4 protein [Candidatus Hydrogenedentota bacterium]
MSVAQAVSNSIYARTYGFSDASDLSIERAIQGEQYFLGQCTLIWTNSRWTAQGLIAQGVSEDRIRVYPPACGVRDPGVVDREWSQRRILFIGVDWERKGGPLLVEAFRRVRRQLADARLTIIGCSPQVSDEGVEILGYLSKANPNEARLIEQALSNASVFCMPTHFDTTGIVFLESAMYGLPSIMLAGQGREEIFPSDTAIHVSEPCPDQLADVLIEMLNDPDRLASMGERARANVLEKHTWEETAKVVFSYLIEAVSAKTANGA